MLEKLLGDTNEPSLGTTDILATEDSGEATEGNAVY
jgi:hypothetical protein